LRTTGSFSLSIVAVAAERFLCSTLPLRRFRLKLQGSV
jgi:hypothetical protein